MPTDLSVPIEAPTPPRIPSANSSSPKLGRECSDTEYRVVEIRNLDELRLRVEDWRNLAEATGERNPFYEPSALLPALEALPPQSDIHFLFVYRNEQTNPPSTTPVGFFPFVADRGSMGLSQWSLWRHPYCFLTLPLIRPKHESGVLNAVFKEIATRPDGPRLTRLPLAPGEGRFHQACVSVIRDRLLTAHVVDEYGRAELRVPDDPEVYLKEALSGHHLRELRRVRRKLDELGTVEYRRWTPQESLPIWMDWFLDLEANGWKARSGTAIRCQPRHDEYFRDLLTRFAEENRVVFDGLFLDGRPIVMSCLLLSPPAGFGFKVAFNEELGKYSPGLQLELERIRRGTLAGAVKFVDSCAVADHPMMNRIWQERRMIRELVISNGRWTSDLTLGLLLIRRCLNRLWRRRSGNARIT